MTEFESFVPYRLRALMDEDRTPHAIALECADKNALKRCAELITLRVLCKSDKDRPCGECSACIKISGGNHPDVYTAKSEGKRNTVKISEIRAICADSVYKPNESDCKIYIIPEADKMEPSPQNAFLKLIEEPPQPMLFILLCENVLGLLQTVRSRCAVFRLSGDDSDDIEICTAAENIALSVCKSREAELMYACAALNDRQQSLKILKRLGEIVREAVSCGITGKAQDCEAAVKELSLKVGKRGLLKMQESILNARRHIDRNVNMTLVSTVLSENLWNDKYL